MRYQIMRQLRLNQQTYPVGVEIDLTEAQAKYLLLSGQIQPVTPKKKGKADDGNVG